MDGTLTEQWRLVAIGTLEWRQWQEVHQLREPIYDCEDGCITIRCGKPVMKFRDMGPGTMRDWQQPQKPSRGLVRDLLLGVDRTGSHKLQGISPYSEPPKELIDDGQGESQPRIACHARGMAPLENMGVEMSCSKVAIGGIVTAKRVLKVRGYYLLLDSPGDCSHDGGRMTYFSSPETSLDWNWTGHRA